jgi:hypothetical protein
MLSHRVGFSAAHAAVCSVQGYIVAGVKNGRLRSAPLELAKGRGEESRF